MGCAGSLPAEPGRNRRWSAHHPGPVPEAIWMPTATLSVSSGSLLKRWSHRHGDRGRNTSSAKLSLITSLSHQKYKEEGLAPSWHTVRGKAWLPPERQENSSPAWAASNIGCLYSGQEAVVFYPCIWNGKRTLYFIYIYIFLLIYIRIYCYWYIFISILIYLSIYWYIYIYLIYNVFILIWFCFGPSTGHVGP